MGKIYSCYFVLTSSTKLTSFLFWILFICVSFSCLNCIIFCSFYICNYRAVLYTERTNITYSSGCYMRRCLRSIFALSNCSQEAITSHRLRSIIWIEFS
nr:MAG TPA_asm: hypothetical protein [Bacteriophage sp.]